MHASFVLTTPLPSVLCYDADTKCQMYLIIEMLNFEHIQLTDFLLREYPVIDPLAHIINRLVDQCT